MRSGNEVHQFCKIRLKIAPVQYFDVNFLPLSVDCKLFREEDIKMVQKRYVVTRLKFVHSLQGEESEWVWDDSRTYLQQIRLNCSEKQTANDPSLRANSTLCLQTPAGDFSGSCILGGRIYISRLYHKKRWLQEQEKKVCLLCEGPRIDSCNILASFWLRGFNLDSPR